MDNDNYNHIRHATNEHISEMLGQYNLWRRGLPPYEFPGSEPFTPAELGIIIDEAARRLRIPPYQTFNDEAFDM